MRQTFLVILSLKQCITSIRCHFHPGILHCDMLPTNISCGPLTANLKEPPQLILSAVAVQENQGAKSKLILFSKVGADCAETEEFNGSLSVSSELGTPGIKHQLAGVFRLIQSAFSFLHQTDFFLQV